MAKQHTLPYITPVPLNYGFNYIKTNWQQTHAAFQINCMCKF